MTNLDTLHVKIAMRVTAERDAHRLVLDTATVIVDDDGNQVGYVANYIGGAVELRDTSRNVTAWLLPADLWHSFQIALDTDHPTEHTRAVGEEPRY